MSSGFLSQEEIDALLNGGGNTSEPSQSATVYADISEVEKDLLGEIGNITMGSASTALSTIINQQVNITTPLVTVTTLNDLKGEFEIPNIALEVKYTSGIMGENLLVMKITDAAVIANLMMGGNGVVEEVNELSEIELSAVSEAMNQMIGSAATSMATMFMREVNISPPESRIWNDMTSPLASGINDNEPVVKVSFSLKIGNLVDSFMMQLLPISTAKKIVSIMMGQEEEAPQDIPVSIVQEPSRQHQEPAYNTAASYDAASSYDASGSYDAHIYEKTIETPAAPKVEVQQASFPPLTGGAAPLNMPRNIDLILDVPLEISVVLGKTKKSIKDILNLGTGSLIELDKLAEEPVEILVNGKKVAYGEVVVVDENFGVRITNIISSAERIKTLKD